MYAANFVSGFSRIVHVLKTTTSASSWRRRLAEAELLEHALDPLGVVGVHLAPERRDVVALHRPKGSDLRGTARYVSSMLADPTESGLSPR